MTYTVARAFKTRFRRFAVGTAFDPNDATGPMALQELLDQGFLTEDEPPPGE
jgi:hypothetical protein